jgi:hypothetical protein
MGGSKAASHAFFIPPPKHNTYYYHRLNFQGRVREGVKKKRSLLDIFDQLKHIIVNTPNL